MLKMKKIDIAELKLAYAGQPSTREKAGGIPA
jgi:hypothetical protein